MRYLISATLIGVSLIHLLPLVGVLGSERLASLYGVAVADPNLLILLRHRAVLFGLLGGFMVLAALRSSVQPLAFAAGFVSVASFVGLAWTLDGYNAHIARVIAVDIGALVLLVIGAVALVLVRMRR